MRGGARGEGQKRKKKQGNPISFLPRHLVEGPELPSANVSIVLLDLDSQEIKEVFQKQKIRHLSGD